MVAYTTIDAATGRGEAGRTWDGRVQRPETDSVGLAVRDDRINDRKSEQSGEQRGEQPDDGGDEGEPGRQDCVHAEDTAGGFGG